MIELNDTKVLRFTDDEVKRLGDEHRRQFGMMIDWLVTILEREYPDMYVIAKTHDPLTNIVWVIMRRDYPFIEQIVKYDDAGNVSRIEEKLLN